MLRRFYFLPFSDPTVNRLRNWYCIYYITRLKNEKQYNNGTPFSMPYNNRMCTMVIAQRMALLTGYMEQPGCRPPVVQ